MAMLIQLGLAERALHGNAIYNSTALIGPQGVIGVYRKLHNTFEFPYFSPGEETPVFATSHGTMASLICYDLCFPELLRTYAVNGAELVLMSTAWPMKGHDRSSDYHGWAMDLAAQSNAFFNQFWIVVSNHCETGAYSQGCRLLRRLANRRSTGQGGRISRRRGGARGPPRRSAPGGPAVAHRGHSSASTCCRTAGRSATGPSSTRATATPARPLASAPPARPVEFEPRHTKLARPR